jgi:hypothetical protein
MVQKATPLQSRCGSLRETQRQKRALWQSTNWQYFDAASHSLLRFTKREWRKMPRR